MHEPSATPILEHFNSARGQCRGPLRGPPSAGLGLPCSHAIGSSFLTSEWSSTSSIRDTGMIQALRDSLTSQCVARLAPAPRSAARIVRSPNLLGSNSYPVTRYGCPAHAQNYPP
jgi:hypothetical protein